MEINKGNNQETPAPLQLQLGGSQTGWRSCHRHDANGRRRDFAVAVARGNGVVKLVPHPVGNAMAIANAIAVVVVVAEASGSERQQGQQGQRGLESCRTVEVYCHLTAASMTRRSPRGCRQGIHFALTFPPRGRGIRIIADSSSECD